MLVVLALSLFERAQDVRMYGVVPWWSGVAEWSGRGTCEIRRREKWRGGVVVVFAEW